MAKYKICPVCNHKNPPSLLECEIDEVDLSTVHVTDDTFFESAPSQPAAVSAPAVRMVRICEECGALNRPNDRKCKQCGEDISDVMPVAEESLASPVKEMPGNRMSQMNQQTPIYQQPQEPQQSYQSARNYMLSSLNGDFLYQISEGETTVGREAELADYLSERYYVGRNHAILRLVNNRLTIQNLRAANNSYINNEKIDDRVVELHEGDEIGLGGNSVNGRRQDQAAYFRVVRK